jgi:hypothetical protein
VGPDELTKRNTAHTIIPVRVFNRFHMKFIDPGRRKKPVLQVNPKAIEKLKEILEFPNKKLIRLYISGVG